jgi:DNA-binding LytR/AlgR family response regulator
VLYIQACGDYVTLFTPTGQYIKEKTMKFFDTYLPSTTFVRIHRSTIVNTDHIVRVELFGKESYSIRLKNGVSLRASITGYKLLKERLNL